MAAGDIRMRAWLVSPGRQPSMAWQPRQRYSGTKASIHLEQGGLGPEPFFLVVYGLKIVSW
jgi:hypothetical protein